MKKLVMTMLLGAVLASGAFGESGELPEGYVKVDYIESSGGAYIDTEYHPTLKTRIEADFDPLAIESWGSFFGVTKNDDSNDGILMRYYGGDDVLNGWFCNENYHEAQISGVANRRIQVKLKTGEMTVNGSSATITTTGTPYDGSIYLFSVNYNGKPYRTHAMRLYSFTIYDTDDDGNERKVCDLVPCVRKSDGLAGLYDLDGERFMGNAGSGAFEAAKGAQFATVTMPKLEHVVVSWTCGDGTVTNPVADASFDVLKGVPFKVMFAPSSSVFGLKGPTVYESVGVSEDMALTDEQVPVIDFLPVEYIDADGSLKMCDEYDVVTETTSELKSGWYVVAENVSRGSLAVNGNVHLILTDGCELKTGETDKAGVFVRERNSLTIYGQKGGTGKLTATGDVSCAGIGGENPGWQDGHGSCGSVTINGGTVTARGGTTGAGIGGGRYGAGGTVAINGGTVTATGGTTGAGIGGGRYGAGGTVAINGGRLNVNADNEASVIGAGYDGGSQGEVSITGGIFAWKPDEDWLGDQDLKVFHNPDATTCADYPWAVLPAVRITLERSLEHLTAVWTCSEVTVSNAIEGTPFFVMKEATGAKVIFTPKRNCRFKDANETGVRVLASPLKEGCTVVPPEAEGIPGSDADPWNVGEDVTAYMSDNGALVIGGTGAMADFAIAASVPWAAVAGEVTEVTVAEGVTHIGKNAFVGMADAVAVNGTPLSTYDMMAGARGYRAGGASPSGAISGAEFEQVEIKDGKAYLDVSVYTSDAITNQNWSVATNGVIEVPAPGKQGFFYLMSRPMGK